MALTTPLHIAPSLRKEYRCTSIPPLGLRGLCLGELYLYLYLDNLQERTTHGPLRQGTEECHELSSVIYKWDSKRCVCRRGTHTLPRHSLLWKFTLFYGTRKNVILFADIAVVRPSVHRFAATKSQMPKSKCAVRCTGLHQIPTEIVGISRRNWFLVLFSRNCLSKILRDFSLPNFD